MHVADFVGAHVQMGNAEIRVCEKACSLDFISEFSVRGPAEVAAEVRDQEGSARVNQVRRQVVKRGSAVARECFQCRSGAPSTFLSSKLL